MSKIYETYYKDTKIEVIYGNITNLKVDGIVNTTNSLMKMDGGVAGRIKIAAGEEIEKEVIKNLKKIGGQCPIGKVILTSAGKLQPNIKYIIHAPIINEPTESSSQNRIKSAVRGVMNKVYEINLNEPGKFATIAFPAMGFEAGEVLKDKIAQAMVDGIINYFNTTVNTSVKSVIFCDTNEEQVLAFKNALINSIN